MINAFSSLSHFLVSFSSCLNLNLPLLYYCLVVVVFIIVFAQQPVSYLILRIFLSVDTQISVQNIR